MTYDEPENPKIVGPYFADAPYIRATSGAKKIQFLTEGYGSMGPTSHKLSVRDRLMTNRLVPGTIMDEVGPNYHLRTGRLIPKQLMTKNWTHPIRMRGSSAVGPCDFGSSFRTPGCPE